MYHCVFQMSQKFRHFIGYQSISDFLKQIPPRNTLIILFIFYTHQSLSTKTKRFGAGCSSPGSWLKINGSVLRDQKVWKKTKELNMCRIYICFEKSLIDKFLRTLKKKISYLYQGIWQNHIWQLAKTGHSGGLSKTCLGHQTIVLLKNFGTLRESADCWLSPTESHQILTESALHCLPTLPLSASLNRCGKSARCTPVICILEKVVGKLKI